MSLENNDIPEKEEINTDDIKSEISTKPYEENSLEPAEEDYGEKKKSNSISKIILYAIFSIIIILCLIVIGRNLFFNKSDKTESSKIEPPKKITDLYELAELNDGYKLINQDVSDTKAVSVYNNEKNEIVFSQSTIKDYKPEYDTSDKNIVKSYFSRGDGQDYTAYQINGKCYIVWTTDEYTFEIKTAMKKSESIPFIFKVQKAEKSWK